MAAGALRQVGSAQPHFVEQLADGAGGVGLWGRGSGHGGTGQAALLLRRECRGTTRGWCKVTLPPRLLARLGQPRATETVAVHNFAQALAIQPDWGNYGIITGSVIEYSVFPVYLF